MGPSMFVCLLRCCNSWTKALTVLQQWNPRFPLLHNNWTLDNCGENRKNLIVERDLGSKVLVRQRKNDLRRNTNLRSHQCNND